MNDKAFIEALAKVLEVDASEINADFKLEDGVIDSIAVLDVIALVNEHYQVNISGKEINECASVGDLLRLLHSKSE